MLFNNFVLASISEPTYVKDAHLFVSLMSSSVFFMFLEHWLDIIYFFNSINHINMLESFEFNIFWQIFTSFIWLFSDIGYIILFSK
jgi:hypothetical protein